jgi:hypothetical protein
MAVSGPTSWWRYLACIGLFLLSSAVETKSYTFECGGLFSSKSCESNCPAGQRANNWCNSGFGFAFEARCTCEDVPNTPAAPNTPPLTCSILAQSYSCKLGNASLEPVVQGTDAGCSASCTNGKQPFCNPYLCDPAAKQFTHSVCGCR